MRGLSPSGTESEADLRINGQLRSYNIRAVSYSAADQVRDYILTIDVELSVTRKGQVTPFWKGSVQGKQVFPANSNLSVQRSSEEAALASAARTVAQKIYMSLEQSF